MTKTLIDKFPKYEDYFQVYTIEPQGITIIHMTCKLRTTAERLLKAYTNWNGSTFIRKVKLFPLDGEYYAPTTITETRKIDIEKHEKDIRINAIFKRMIDAGLSKDDIGTISKYPIK